MFLQFTDGLLSLIPSRISQNSYTDDVRQCEYLYLNEIIVGQSWTKQTNSGVSFSWDGAGLFTIASQGANSQVLNLTQWMNTRRMFACIGVNEQTGIPFLYFPYDHSNTVSSGGNTYYFFVGVDGTATGSFPNYELFLASAALYSNGWFAINFNSNGGGELNWYQHLFEDGWTLADSWTYALTWEFNTDLRQALENDIINGYSISYNLSNCTGDENNPDVVPENNTSTELVFTPTDPAFFDGTSISISAPVGHVPEYTWDSDTGVLTLGVIDANITISVSAYGGEDPYDPAGDTGGDDTPGDGGDGDFDDDTDPIPIPDVPDETEVSASNSRFITLFAPTTGQLNDLANYMWSSSFDLDTFKMLFANPMDCILGLSTIPFTPTTNGTGTVTVGNISTGVNMTKCKQYKEIDCGTINVKKYWGAYLDYAPFTKAEIYLPFIGMRPLSVDDIMGKSVHVVYHIDVLSGACVAYIKCGNSVLYNFVGQCSQSIPVTSNDFTNVVNGALGIAGAIGSMVASGGASAPYAAGTLVSSAINALKPNIERSGGLAGGASMMEIKKPYLVLTRPKQALAKNQSKYMGLPTWITRTLSSVSGYTRVEHVKLEKTHATEEEQKEIISLLKEGVFL